MNKDKSLIGNEKIEQDIAVLKDAFTEENLATVLTTIRKRCLEGGQFVIAVDAGGSSVAGNSFSMRAANYQGKKWFVAFTSFDEEIKGNNGIMSGFLADIGQLLDMTEKSDEVEGIVLNPYGNMITLNKSIISVIQGEK